MALLGKINTSYPIHRYHPGSTKMVAGQKINFPGRVGGRMAGWEELEIRLSSGQRKVELGLGLSLAIILSFLAAWFTNRKISAEKYVTYAEKIQNVRKKC